MNNKKNRKKLKNRLVAGIMSAAMLTSAGANMMTSIPVSAADNDYYEALALSLYFFDANACGSDVKENPLTWRGNCHTYDGKAAISEAENFDSSAKSLVDPDGDGYVDVDGGYHDAGDHIKFNLTMGFAMSSLAMSEYLNPGIYEKAGAKDHMMAILKRNAEYLMKTTFLNGSEVATICHVVADGNADHAVWSSPEEQTYPRKTYWLTASQNNSAVCGEMASALAGAAYVWKDADSSFASECLKYAKAIYNFGSAHKGNYTGGLSTFYETNSMCEDELALAQAWLWINGAGDKPTLTPSRGQYNGIYDCYRYTWDKVWQGYAAMMYKATGDSVFKDELEYEISNAGGLTTGKYNGDGWGASRYNCALQMSGYAVANGDASNQYAQAGKWQMDYILGDNPTGYSFLIGYGSKSPTHYHHRAANPGTGNPQDNTAAKYTLYGALVGGIDASGNYEDHSNKYEYTEPALDYNGCFALACAALADLYGGSDKGAASILSGASEVTYPFNFVSGTTVTPPPTEPTPTAPTPTDPTPTDPTPT
ncbi:MAG: glycoside hydrolase family 9 protein, partial [Oscillospiraceae bacterium]|nr:glycoside hydrolase family 9 protein [Oscillospiraceae bacterium]